MNVQTTCAQPIVSSRCMATSRWRVAAALMLSFAAPLALAQQLSVTRSSEFEYDPASGQLTLERVDPGGEQCVETAYGLDDYGNRQTVTVRPCASTSASASFAPRVTTNYFDASTDPANLFPAADKAHPAGAYLTRSVTGTAPGPTSESRSSFDPRFGTARAQSEVGAGAARTLSKRADYDSLGRLRREYAPVKRNADGSVVESYVEYSYVYCTAAGQANCLDISQQVPVDYAESKRLVDVNGNVTSTAEVGIVTAYYVETVAKDSAGTVVGARARTHFDALHRQIAQEKQGFDGRWVRALTGYDQLGMVAATWGEHFGDLAVGSAGFNEMRQRTASRDLLHRPLDQRSYWRAKQGDGAVELATVVTYNGLETRSTMPADSAPDGVARTSYLRKNGAGQTAQTENADGATLVSAYDPVGNLLKTVDALGNQTTLSYTPTTARFKTGMVDADQGAWDYSYDAVGQLKSQTDGRRKLTTMVYDSLGRMTSKLTDHLNAYWYFDKDASGVVCAAGLNRLCESKSGETPAVARSKVEYDGLGRAFRTTNTLDKPYVSEAAFDDLGRLSTTRYPTGFTVKYRYAAAADGVTPGALIQVSDNANASRVFWSIAPADLPPSQVFDAKGNLLAARLGNGQVAANVFDAISGKPFRLSSTKGADIAARQSYEYDKARNVIARVNERVGTFENFAYDLLDRLTRYTVTASVTDAGAAHVVNVSYNALGNILEKSDVGGYAYTANDKPHAVRSVAGNTYSYDGNGNIIGSTGAQARTQSWTDFNMPDVLSLQGKSVAFLYDANYTRVQEVTTAAGTVRNLYLVHPDNVGGLAYERELTQSTGLPARDESRHYISVGGVVVAVVKTLNEAGTVSSDANLTNYWHKDGLGSIVSVTNADGAVVEAMAFDAWGRRQRDGGRPDPYLDPANGNRGYTGHEHLDELGLIHMNGRVYDPFIARFLSADPYVQSADNLQSYNRYAYVLNNPMGYTDPSGYLAAETWFAIKVVTAVLAAAAISDGNKYWKMVGTVALTWALGGTNASQTGPGVLYEMGVTNSFANASLAAFTASYASTGDVASAMLAAQTAGAMNVAGGIENDIARLITHAVIGCMSAEAGAGDCGPSAAAAGFSEWVTQRLPNGSLKFPAVLIAGGTASVIGGGKFANGVMTAAIGYLFNCSEHKNCSSSEEYRSLVEVDPMGNPAGGNPLAGAAVTMVGGTAAVGAAVIGGIGFSPLAALPDGLVASRLSILTNVELNAIIGPSRSAINAVFGSGVPGAVQALMGSAIPAASRAQLMAYRELVSRQFADTPRLVMELRMMFIDRILNVWRAPK